MHKLTNASIAIPKVTFAYIGVELLTTTAYEARDASQLKNTAMFIVPQVCIIYVAIAITFVSNVAWDDRRLPQIFGQASERDISGGSSSDATTGTAGNTSSALPIIALIETGSTTLASVLTGILMYSGLSAANTALYVASRTLYGFARNIEVTDKSRWYRKTLYGASAVLPWTGAPLWGVIVPVVLLCWLPFIHLSEDSTKRLLQEVLLNIGSVSAVLVWFSQCIAYIFYWRRREYFRTRIESSNDTEVRRLIQNSGKHSLLAAGQPVLAGLGAIGTFSIVFVFNSVVLWNGKVFKVKFFAAFLSPILMTLLFLTLKAKRTRLFTSQTVKHWGVDLSDYRQFEVAVQRLNGMINPVSRAARRRRSFFDIIRSLFDIDTFRTADTAVRVSPATTGSETRDPTYRVGNFEPFDVEEHMNDDVNYHANTYARPEMMPQPTPSLIVPRVHVHDDEWHEMADRAPALREPRNPRNGAWVEI